MNAVLSSDRATVNAQIAQAQAALDTANAQLTQLRNQPRASDAAAATGARSGTVTLGTAGRRRPPASLVLFVPDSAAGSDGPAARFLHWLSRGKSRSAP